MLQEQLQGPKSIVKDRDTCWGPAFHISTIWICFEDFRFC
jgi:hypothetical protein